jgi:T-complex protein 1 subunit eta
MNEDIEDNFKSFVWEPAVVKINAIAAATEATCLILSVDETIKSPKSGGSDMSANNPYGPGGGMM